MIMGPYNQIDAFYRFNNPAKYLVEKEGSAVWHVVDNHTIMYKTVCKDDAVIIISSKHEGQYRIKIEKAGEISPITWSSIHKMHKELQKESEYHKIKRAILNIPKPSFIKLIYDDEGKKLRVFDDENDLVCIMEESGACKIMKHEMHKTVRNYVHEITLGMLYA